ncbi:1614_t:CDS:1, partial [Gigaspora rosea]
RSQNIISFKNLPPSSKNLSPNSKNLSSNSKNLSPNSENLPPSSKNLSSNSKNVSKNSKNISKNSKNISKSSKSSKGYSFTIVTAVSSNHWCQLTYWINNIYNIIQVLPNYIKPRIIIYDLGLNKTDKIILEKSKEKYQKLYELRNFKFSKYPNFWNLDNITRGEFGWKVGIIKEMSIEFPGYLIWSDTGTFISQKALENLSKILKKYNGFISPKSSGKMGQWTHPGVYKYFNDDGSKYEKLPNCNGALLFFDTKKTQYLIDAWYKCALKKECIAPPGSNITNHRQDQAILTYLITIDHRKCGGRLLDLARTHKFDINCKRDIEIKKYINDEYNL